MADGLFQELTGGITAAKGFTAGGVYCGVRKVKKDIAIIYSETPATVASVFTKNKVVAAPLVVDKEQLGKSSVCSAVVVNSGNANACTGEQGMNDAWKMVTQTAEALNVPKEQVLVSSTGVIGQYLPMENISKGIQELAGKLSAQGGTDAAEAIMTTDTFSKEIAVRMEMDSVVVTLGGMCKGSGMISPNMATMLGFVTTDAVISQSALKLALRKANERSFNRLTVDGDMSTNDMVLVLANGAAKNKEIVENTPAFEKFSQALEYVLISLTKMIARDGEGASKLIEIVVSGAKTEEEAAQAARSVAHSNLVKTAMHGADANWGRVLAAVGYSGIEFDPAKVSISFNDVAVLKPNYEIVLDEEKAKAVLMQDTIFIYINLHQGPAHAQFWTCDLTKEYIHINASYRT
ncbi:MAG TPA: bifunctional glutamate N-acetyltransferase/amino-acid acetyltransferase ArgJ [Bacteroidota bacterium]|nr:bifunctional glutamate N-acetyltransferase/amino-acid acetyltransferase ArgJ [Bacteroidota bacterium]